MRGARLKQSRLGASIYHEHFSETSRLRLDHAACHLVEYMVRFESVLILPAMWKKAKRFALIMLLLVVVVGAYSSYVWFSLRAELREMHEREVQEAVGQP